MITCAECLQRLYPDDPRVRSGKYMRCGCDYCDKPSYYRELEAPPEPQVVEHIHRTSDMSRKEFVLLQQMALKLEYLEKKVEEQSKPKWKTRRYQQYENA